MILQPRIYEDQGGSGCFPSGFCVFGQTPTKKNLILIEFIKYKMTFWTWYTLSFSWWPTIFPHRMSSFFSVLSTVVKHIT
jgi:hypothetical protein